MNALQPSANAAAAGTPSPAKVRSMALLLPGLPRMSGSTIPRRVSGIQDDLDLACDDDDDECPPEYYLQSFAEARFRQEFHVSRPVFYHHLRLLLQSGEFDEKHAGDGTTGRRSHPLHLKLAFPSPSHVCMRTFPTIAARHWCASVNEQ